MLHANVPFSNARRWDMKRVVLLAIATGLSTAAVSRTAAADELTHSILNNADIHWGAAPPMFPTGAKMAVPFADPAKPGRSSCA
jgi:hypothetical protein